MCNLRYFLLILGTGAPKAGDAPQRVQILRGPDGKIQVRGLMPGQQLVQMPDGKLHVLSTTDSPQTTSNVANTSSTKLVASPAKMVSYLFYIYGTTIDLLLFFF